MSKGTGISMLDVFFHFMDMFIRKQFFDMIDKDFLLINGNFHYETFLYYMGLSPCSFYIEFFE